MVEYTVDRAKLFIILLLFAVFSLGLGYYAAALTAPPAKPASTVVSRIYPPVLELLNNKTINEPQQSFKYFKKGVAFTHAIVGKVADVSANTFSLTVGNSTLEFEKLSRTSYFIAEGSNITTATAKDLQVGDTVRITLLSDRQTKQQLYSTNEQVYQRLTIVRLTPAK